MTDNIYESGLGIDGAKIATSEAVYRAGFPAFRVFVYYQEITQDVVEVRVNNTGGSAERSASSASITLLNPLDKYTITTFDTMQIGAEEARINDRANQISFTEIEELHGAHAQLWQEVTSLAASGNIEGLKTYLNYAELDLDDFITTTYEGEEIINKESMIAAIMEAGKLIAPDLPLDNISSEGSASIKYDVLSKKLKYQTAHDYDKNITFARQEDEVTLDYPFQKGDCIFHPNDPVRIAFRDPFDARVWYWKFAGFVDTWTENVGTNKESTLTLNCTDVTKMARYTYAQINTGIFDQALLPDGTLDSDQGELLLFHKNLFAGFEIYEILEILFFGAESLEGRLTADVRSFIADLSDQEAAAYLIQNFNAIGEDLNLQNAIFNTEDISNDNLQKSIRAAIFELRRAEVVGRLPKLRKLSTISHPSGTQFQRRDDKQGVHVYFYGDPDEYDLQIGEGIKDLKTWNEVIHHRVRVSDLDTMSVLSGLAGEVNVSGSNVSNIFPDISTWDMDKIITTIGTNVDELYPVGGGRVFYFTSAGLRELLDTNAVDKSFGGTSSMHSEFIDNLSFLYDLADNIEYCFYATPKGDVVFEMPFYDFDVEDFTTEVDVTDNSFNTSELVREYDKLFQEAYSGTYTDMELSEMTNLVFNLTAEGTNYPINDYENQPVFDYLRNFTIEPYEQYGFTNSNSDVGVCTAARSTPVLVPGNSSLDGGERRHALLQMANLYPLLGTRMMSAEMLGFIDDYDIAKLYLALQLNRVNAEARNVSVSTVPKFGLMVNRPVKWKVKTYSANVVSLSDSIVWNSSCETSVSLNQVRGWSGGIDSQTGRPKLKHFGGDRPFDLAKLLKGSGGTGQQ